MTAPGDGPARGLPTLTTVAAEVEAISGRLAALSGELHRLSQPTVAASVTSEPVASAPVASAPAAPAPVASAPAAPAPTGSPGAGWAPPTAGWQQRAAPMPYPPGARPPYPYGAPNPVPPPPPGQRPRQYGPPPGPQQARVRPPRRPRRGVGELIGRDGVGGSLLGWVGGSVTLLGVVLLLVLAVQRGYLGPLPRVLTGAVLALALVAIGARLGRRERARGGAVTLVATGVAALYLDLVAATDLYRFLPLAAGLGLGVLVACGGLGLALRWRAQSLAIAAVAGAALLIPVLTKFNTAPVPLLGFLLVLQVVAVGAAVLAGRPRGEAPGADWAPLYVVGSVPPVFAALVVDALVFLGPVPVSTAAVILLVSVVAVVAAVLAAYLRPDGPHGAVAHSLLVAAPAPALLVAPALPVAAGIAVAASCTVVFAGLWALGRSGRVALVAGFGAVAGLLAAVSALVTALLAADGSVLAPVLIGFGVALACGAHRLRGHGMLGVATGFGVVGGFLALGTALPPSAMSDYPLGSWLRDGFTPVRDVPELVTAALTGVLLVAAAVTLYRAWRAVVDGMERAGAVTLGILAWLVGLYGAAGFTLASALLIAPTRTAFLAGHVVITVSWTVAALVILARARNSVTARTAGMGLAAAAVAKLVLFDLAALDGFARVAAFLGAGLVLLTAGARGAASPPVRG